ERHRLPAAQRVPRAGLGEAVLHPAEVAHADRAPARVGDDDVAELLHRRQPAQGAHAQLGLAADDAPAGRLHVLVLDRGLALLDGQPVGVELVRVGIDADLTLAGPREADVADAVHRLQQALDLLVR